MGAHDIVVVGGGAAGAPLAARLSENAEIRVCLIEAGPDYDQARDWPAVLRKASTLESIAPDRSDNWRFEGAVTDDRNVVVPRGRLLGGSTALNATYFVRARVADFDRWSDSGNDLWRYENVLPYYRRLETDEDYGETPVHGGDGPMLVHRPRMTDHDEMIRAACLDLGVPEELDKNDQSPSGVGPIPLNSPGGVRLNTGMAYLSPVRAGRPNLTVLGDTLVRRVLFEGTRAVGVEVEDLGGTRRITAGTVVLCAGAMKTPHLLMLSGIGDADELARVGIPLVAHVPGVGRSFTDHPQLAVDWVTRHVVGDYSRTETLSQAANLTSGLDDTADDLELLMGDKPVQYQLSGRRDPRSDLSATVRVLLLRESSRGRIRLRSSDPHLQPEFAYGYLATALDRAKLRYAIRLVDEMLRSTPLSALFAGYRDLTAEVLADDDDLDRWVRSSIYTAVHMAGTAKFAVGDDPTAVTDQDGSVRGVKALRIADPSILPDTGSRGIAATAVMIGELMADVIRKELGERIQPVTPRRS